MEDFADSYLRGETPIPCIRCNQTGEVPRPAGHRPRPGRRGAGDRALCAPRGRAPTGPELHRAIDPARDQSYFLFATTREQLDFLRFPLGGMHKPEVRGRGRALRAWPWPTSRTARTSASCRTAIRQVVEKLRPARIEPGDIVHIDGRVMGRHEGIIHYTIGQRKGLGIGGQKGDQGDPLYVVRLDPARHRVVVGPKSSLARDRVLVREVNWLGRAALPMRPAQRSTSSSAPPNPRQRPPPSRRRTAAPRSSWTKPSSAWRPVRPASSTRATGCWAAAGSPQRKAGWQRRSRGGVVPRPKE